ncbi:MAG: hypothetical protein R1F52_04405 [Candidatus Nitrosoabyssus spongiisocia]|nr:MAG: hypothetical protein R1F52_04405 [Nitrosopumilaceae archaeon AB1(1)]
MTGEILLSIITILVLIGTVLVHAHYSNKLVKRIDDEKVHNAIPYLSFRTNFVKNDCQRDSYIVNLIIQNHGGLAKNIDIELCSDKLTFKTKNIKISYLKSSKDYTYCPFQGTWNDNNENHDSNMAIIFSYEDIYKKEYHYAVTIKYAPI